MNNKKATKRALLTSVMALVMCVVMLVGTTFAWFTDTASTGVNKIQAGNLDIEVEYTLDGETWKDLDRATDIFQKGLWEPGHSEVVGLKIHNAGNLALKYSISMNIANETKGINKAGDEFALSDYLKVKTSTSGGTIGAVLVAAAFGSRNMSNAWQEVDFKAVNAIAVDVAQPVVSATYPDQYYVIKVYMPEEVGNEANAISVDKTPSIEFGINVVATQDTVERDSFGSDYDKDATYPVMSNEGLKDAINGATAGDTVVIASGEYDLPKFDASEAGIPAGATIAGAGADKTTLNVSKDEIKNDNVTLKDMTIKGSGSQGTRGTLNINGNNTTIENIDYKGDGNIAIAVSTGGSNSGTTFRGTKITNAFRGIQFWSLSGDSVIDNCVLDVAGYTFNIDAAVEGSTLTITNSTLNGWTSYTSGIELVTFENCKLGLNAYEYLRPYSETKLISCEFTSGGYQLNAGGSDDYTITLTDCTKNGTPITADNVKALLLDTEDWNTNAILIVNGVSVSV